MRVKFAERTERDPEGMLLETHCSETDPFAGSKAL